MAGLGLIWHGTLGIMASEKSELGRLALGVRMDERRQDLGLTWDQVAVQAKIHRETLRTIRRGTGDLRPLTKRGIENALRWTAGSVDRILDGRAPVPLAETGPSTGDDDFDARIERIRADPRLRRRLVDLIVAARLDPVDERDDEDGGREDVQDAG